MMPIHDLGDRLNQLKPLACSGTCSNDEAVGLLLIVDQISPRAAAKQHEDNDQKKIESLQHSGLPITG